MSHELTIELGYSAGQIDVRFEGESYPDNWNDRQASLSTAVQEELFEIADLHEWRNSFETAQEYSMPGMSPEPEVGTVTVDDEDGATIDLDIETIHDCDWE